MIFLMMAMKSMMIDFHLPITKPVLCVILKYQYTKMDVNGVCWDKYIKGKFINGLPMYVERAHYGVCRKKCFISYVCISHVKSLVSIDTYL